MITVSEPENVTIIKVIKKTWHGNKHTRKALAGMHYIESDRSLKVITNKWKFIVKMTAEGYRVSGLTSEWCSVVSLRLSTTSSPTTNKIGRQEMAAFLISMLLTRYSINYRSNLVHIKPS